MWFVVQFFPNLVASFSIDAYKRWEWKQDIDGSRAAPFPWRNGIQRPWNWGDRFILLLWWLLFQWMIGFGGNLGVGSSGVDCLIQPFFVAVETKQLQKMKHTNFQVHVYDEVFVALGLFGLESMQEGTTNVVSAWE
ncbi:hypothetical protein AHAS_Ahas19G0020900 [Arachis hypogaea]